MIHSLSFSNIGSFSDEATIDFTWMKKDSIDDTLVTDLPSEINVSKIMTILWANASWKSNILRVFSFLKFWIGESLTLPPDLPLTNQGVPFRPLPFLYTTDRGSKIECIFETKIAQYKIELTIEEGLATEEIISIRSKTEKRMTWKTLFSRTDLSIQKSLIYRRNASILFVKHRDNDPNSKDIIDYWNEWVFNKVSQVSLLENQNIDFNRGNAIVNYYKNPESLDFVTNLLKRFDTGFSWLYINEKDNIDGTKWLEIIWKIQRNWEEIEMPFYSDGTLKLIDYAYLIHWAIEKWWVLIFDEIDSSFHPEIVDAILDLFLSKTRNKKWAQIILTTHNPRILNLLNRYQIQLVEKNENGESQTYRLDDVNWVRAKDNYYAKYIAWTYGAVPEIMP